MSSTYKKVEIVGTAQESVSAAIQNGVERARNTLKNLDWFELTEIRGRIEGGEVQEFQVALKIGFRLE